MIDELNFITHVPLVYKDVNTSGMENIMLIDSSIFQSQLFYDSANSNTLSIMYSYTSEKTELLELLRLKFQQGIKRVAFVFHDPSVIKKAFLDNAVFFNDTDLEDNQTNFSENVSFLKDLVTEFNIQYFDYLACNTLQYPIWKQYYDLLQRETIVICGASNDTTGNIQYGADWIMENTNEDIKNIYFTDSINNYSSTLAATTISSNGGKIAIKYVSDTDLQYSLDEGVTWTSIGTNYPINIENTGGSLQNILTVFFTNNLGIINIDTYFVCASSYIKFYCENLTYIYFQNVQNYPGLIQNGTNVVDGFHTITIDNLILGTSGSTTLAMGQGWICQQYFGNNINNISGFDPSKNYIYISGCRIEARIVENYCGGVCGAYTGNNGTVNITGCSHVDQIAGSNSGGICGWGSGSNNGTLTISKCNSENITGSNSGGICGPHAGGTGGIITITDCINYGPIDGDNAGGICGQNAASSGGTVNIIDCIISSGDINGNKAGGMCGQSAGVNGGTVNISGCTNSGSINGYDAGGMCGQNAGVNGGTVNITDCTNYSGGTLASYYSGGICGSNAGYNGGTITISNCHNDAAIEGEDAGGICGRNAGSSNGKVTISKCWNNGKVTDQSSGGIVGAYFAYNTNQLCSITNCYSTSVIDGFNAGGICGACVGLNNTSSYTPIVEITNCYTLGSIYSPGGGILGGIDKSQSSYNHNPVVTLTNCYSNGIVYDADSGLIANSLPIKNSITVTNCYIGNNAWSDSEANAYLIGTPTDITTNNPGTTWTSIETNNPYILSEYNSRMYVTNSVTTTTNSYTSSQGLFQSGYRYSIINSNKLPRTTISINTTNGIITFKNLILNGTPLVTNIVTTKYDSNNMPYDYDINNFTITYSVCFKEDSNILCLINNEETYVKVQDLKPNMLVKTCEDSYVPIDTIGWFHLVNEIDNENRHPDGLYELSTEKYPELTENLVLTGRHSILVDTLKKEHLNNYKFARHIKLYNKHKLPCVANENAKPYKNGTYKIWSFCLQTEDETKNYGIYANGLLVESTNKRDVKNAVLNLVE
jgi:hypothetical protein